MVYASGSDELSTPWTVTFNPVATRTVIKYGVLVCPYTFYTLKLNKNRFDSMMNKQDSYVHSMIEKFELENMRMEVTNNLSELSGKFFHRKILLMKKY